MPNTYDPTTAIGQVRLTVGDTDITALLLQDTEIQYFLGANNINGVGYASAKAARAIAAKYARQVDTSVESVRTSNSQAMAQYLALAARLEADNANNPVDGTGASVFGLPYVGGTSVGTMNARTDNTDLPQPDFVKDMFDDPASSATLPREIIVDQ